MSATIQMPNASSHLMEMRVFSKLSSALLKQVRSLVNRCKHLDGYESPFHWDCIENRKNPFIHEILCYINQKLVGYVSIYYFKEKEVECTIVVQPEYREAKIFRLIWEQIKLTVHRNKIPTEYYTFTLHQKDVKLIDLLRDAEANPINKIYKLVLNKKSTALNLNKEKIPPDSDPNIEFREARLEDAPFLIELECQNFGTEAQAYHENLKGLFANPQQKIYVVTEKEKVIGKVHFKIEKTDAFIFDFCIAANRQNHGFGQFLIQKSLQVVFAEVVNKIYLETDTPHYLKWYKKLGFKETAVHENWKLYYPGFVKYHDQQYRMLVLNHYQEYDLLA